MEQEEQQKEQENNNNSASDLEIKQLKEEIENLKQLHEKDQSEIQIIKNILQTEIPSLKKQIEILSQKFNEEIKNKSQNIINENKNLDDSDEIMVDSSFSVECLSKRVSTEILQGTERTSIDIVIKNNSKQKYPKNTFLIADDKNSLLICEKVELNELEPGQQQNVTFIFKNLRYISKGNYKCIVRLKIDKKIYNSCFELNVNVLENNYKNPEKKIFRESEKRDPFLMDSEKKNPIFVDMRKIEQNIKDFRAVYDLYDYDTIPDEKIERALHKYNNDFSRAFESLFS